MTRDVIIEKINAVFADAFEIEPDRLVPDARIFTDLGLDSLDVVDLVVAIQKSFGVQVREDERMRQIRTLGDLYTFIETLIREKGE